MLGSISAWKLANFTFYYDFPDKYAVYRACFCEIIYTFVLCYNAINVGKSENGLILEGLIVVITVITGAKTIGHLTRNCLNPAVGVSFDVVFYIAHGYHIDHLWVYIISPLCGGVLGGFVNYLYTSLAKASEFKSNHSSLYLNISLVDCKSKKIIWPSDQ